MFKYKKSAIAYILILVVVLILVIYTSISYQNTIYNSLRDDSDMYITETANQSVSSLKTKINKDISMLGDVSLFLKTVSPDNIRMYMAELDRVSENSNFKRIEVCMADGQSYSTDGRVDNKSKEDYFLKGIIGQSGVTSPMTDHDGDRINVYYVPIIDKVQIVGVLCAVQNTKIFENIINLTTFDGAGFAYISENTGLLFATSQNSKVLAGQTLFDLSDSNKSENALKIQTIIDNMRSGREGVAQYTFQGEKQYMRYIPLEMNNWYLVSVLPENVITQKTSIIMRYTTVISVFIMLLFIGVLIYVVYILNRNSKQLEEYAYLDPVTQCRNLNAMERDIKRLFRTKTSKNYVLLQMDIDKFKYINDIYGYQAGNEVLIHIADILTNLTHDGEYFCRISSDCFAVLLEYSERDELMDRINNIINNIENLSVYGSKPLDICVSMGVYMITNTDMPVNIMFDCAAIAHKAVKNNRITKFVFYTEKMHTQINNEKEIESEMVPALAQKQFEVYYQPKYDVLKGTLCGAEALVRWNHPKRGLISPIEFIPIFEKNGSVASLDLYVFEEVCNHLSNWRKQGKPLVPVSVNLSRVHIYEPNFINKYRIILDRYFLPPDLIEFEITETSALDNSQKLIDVINSIHAIGCRVFMDDFGSGYSSFSMLKLLPIDGIKIDQAFFVQSDDDARAKEIVSSIVSLSQRLKLDVIAEGIENLQQVELLKDINCAQAQGFLFAKPMRMPEFEKQLVLSSKGSDLVEK